MEDKQGQLYLFKTKRFLPLFIVQFCGCLNDNILKNALVILITYKLASELTFNPSVLILLANGLFTMPFILFASLAGQIADRFERSLIVKVIKLIEVGIVITIIYGFYHNNLLIIFACIFLLGTHSTFFGPIKYGMLPDHLNPRELLSANGFVEAGTFLSILIGTIIGGYYTIFPKVVTITALIVSIIGLGYSFLLPRSNNENKKILINFHIIRETLNILKQAKSRKQVYLSIMGISWFWFMGAAILSQIPSLTKDILRGDENVATLFLAIFSIGVGIGSFLCNLILKNEITVKYTALCILGLSIFGIDLSFAARISYLNYQPLELSSILIFLSKLHNWRIVIDLFFLSAISGLYVVPLFTVMQYFAGTTYRSRVIAANNLINSIFMVCSALILLVLFYFEFTVPSIILLMSLANIVIAIKIYQKMPEMELIPHKLLKLIFKTFFDAMYQVEVKGIENFHHAGKRTVIIANHLSFIDPALIAVYLPGKITFAINTIIAKIWWIKPFLQIVNALPVDPANPMAIKSLINLVKSNKKVAIFPEGRISTTGSLMKIYEGPGVVAAKSDANILPIRVGGTQYTHFSKLKNIFKLKFFPKITITILPPIKLSDYENLSSKSWRGNVANRLYDIMSNMLFESSNYNQDLFSSLIESAKIHGINKVIFQDIDNNSISYKELLRLSFLIRDFINQYQDQNIGLLLPQAPNSYGAFYGVLSAGKTCAMLNCEMTKDDLFEVCRNSKTNIILSSLKFIKKTNLESVIEKLSKSGIEIIFIENIINKAKIIFKIKTQIASRWPELCYNYMQHSLAESAAVIFFNNDRYVSLTHQNINSNRYQIISKIDFSPHDIAFNTMSITTNMGLCSSIFMVLSGVKSVLYNHPVHYKIIPELIYDSGSTIFFSNYEYLRHYMEHAHPYDFYSLRYVFATIDNYENDLKTKWLNKYGVRIFNIYSKPEASFIISANTPMHNKENSVGKILPKIEYYINEEGKLYIRGPNIVHEVDPKSDEDWFDTGDIAEIDNEGYLMIKNKNV